MSFAKLSVVVAAVFTLAMAGAAPGQLRRER